MSIVILLTHGAEPEVEAAILPPRPGQQAGVAASLPQQGDRQLLLPPAILLLPPPPPSGAAALAAPPTVRLGVLGVKSTVARVYLEETLQFSPGGNY